MREVVVFCVRVGYEVWSCTYLVDHLVDHSEPDAWCVIQPAATPGTWETYEL